MFPGKITFSTSFGLEDQVITHLIASSGVNISFFTLDTGRLFSETYFAWSQTLEQYDLKIRAFYPNDKQLQAFITENGPNAFYRSVQLRKSCCYLRKMAPLKKALEKNAVWITGLRAEQSELRQQLQPFEWDEDHKIIKYHPLLYWSLQEVKEHIKRNQVPYNSLHDKGFPSVGCAPCTRAIKYGEDIRAGRWWWEEGSEKECGLHQPNNQTKK